MGNFDLEHPFSQLEMVEYLGIVLIFPAFNNIIGPHIKNVEMIFLILFFLLNLICIFFLLFLLALFLLSIDYNNQKNENIINKLSSS